MTAPPDDMRKAAELAAQIQRAEGSMTDTYLNNLLRLALPYVQRAAEQGDAIARLHREIVGREPCAGPVMCIIDRVVEERMERAAEPAERARPVDMDGAIEAAAKAVAASPNSYIGKVWLNGIIVPAIRTYFAEKAGRK